MDEITSFGEWLRRARKARDLTQAELAQQVGCAEGTIRNLEADALRPSKQLAARLAARLGLPPEAQVAVVAFARGGATPPILPPLPVPPSAREHAAPTEGSVNLPSGTITFLFTDIEGSTKRWEQEPQEMACALTQHDAMLRGAIADHGGYVFKTVGDAICAAFGDPPAAVAAAVAAQQALHLARWGAAGPLRVRMALHSGVVEAQAGDYQGLPLSRVARLLAAGHGGQILLSRATAELVCDVLPLGVALQDLGTHQLKDLSRPEQIFQLIAPDLPTDFPPLRTLDRHRTNLPAQPTALIGREAEVRSVVDLLQQADVRLVTLSGPGGVGKTRLGLQVAAELLGEFGDGVYFVALAPIHDSTLVAPTIVQTLGIKETRARVLIDLLKDQLRDKHILLLLDNFEQVINAAPLIAELLAGAPHLKMLVTSRAALRLSGEREFLVLPLALPDLKHPPSVERLTQYEAVALFIERTQAVRPDFQVTNANAPAIAEICVRLDGLPLAIELAAARSKLFPPQALLARLSNRLALLTAGARDLPPRQQTLRHTIDWSYKLLDGGEQTLFRRLAVFVGGCTLAAVEAVCNADGRVSLDIVDGVAALVDQSLVRQHEQDRNEPRFTMLETIREYALERLEESGEAEDMRQRHALHYLAVAEAAEPELIGAEQERWLQHLEVEHDNVRVALAWCQTPARDAEAGLRIVGAVWRFWRQRGYLSEGRKYLAGLLARTVAPTSARAKALNGAGVLAWVQGDYDTARAFHEESLAIQQEQGDKLGIAYSLNNLGNIAFDQGDYTAARRLYQESLAIKRELGDKPGIAMSLNNLGQLANNQGDYTAARVFHEESLAINRELGDKWSIATSLNNLGVVASYQGDYLAARALYQESLAIRRELGDAYGSASSLNNLAGVAFDQGDYLAARALYQESLAIKRELGDKLGIAYGLEGLAIVASAQGQAERALCLAAAAAALREAIGSPLPPTDQAYVDGQLAAAHQAVNDVRRSAVWEAGSTLSLEQAIAYALGKNDGGAELLPQLQAIKAT